MSKSTELDYKLQLGTVNTTPTQCCNVTIYRRANAVITGELTKVAGTPSLSDAQTVLAVSPKTKPSKSLSSAI